MSLLTFYFPYALAARVLENVENNKCLGVTIRKGFSPGLFSSYIRITCPCNEDSPYIPLLYSKTGVYRGIHLFLLTEAVLTCTHDICFEQK